MNDINLSYKKAFDLLNDKQRLAVEQIYGPVMVIAGPGTGKTQLLAVRVCYLLEHTDMNPHNVLCLTFTDAGTKAMRNRLMSFMGSDSYHVGVHTYHSFCNQVIREHPEKFSDYRELKNATDLEMVDIMREIIDELPLDHPLKRLKGDAYFDTRKIQSLFNTMKQEGWSHQDIDRAIEEYAEILPTLDDYKYKRKTKGIPKGEPNTKKINDELSKYEKLKHAAPLIEKYTDILRRKDRIDYQDSILYVIKAFKNDDQLLGLYQERYQFILADEYQDTNGTQNELLFLLSSYDETPNLFVVGDDDQAIYRFQGANMNNIVDFKVQFNPKEIVLDQNYRTGQEILDSAMSLIDKNKERLAYKYDHLTKHLSESRVKGFGAGKSPILSSYDSLQAQDVGIISKIEELHSKGVAYNDIGVIYKKHKEVSDLVKYLTYENIPINVKKKVDVLALREVKMLTSILEYINSEKKYPHSAEGVLFQILHFSFFGLKANQIAKIAIFCSKRTDQTTDDLKWRNIIGDEEMLKKAGIIDVKPFVAVSNIIEGWISKQHSRTVQVLFEVVMTESGFLNQLLRDSDKTWKLQVVNTFFNFIKDETSANPDLTLSEIMEMVDKLREVKIGLPISKVVTSTEGINIMTAHSSKGLEFEYVFILNASEEQWMEEQSRGGGFNFKLPPTLAKSSGTSNTEDDRRLFYVAMTRAQNRVYISYSLSRANGKSYTPVRFFSDMGMETSIVHQNVDQDKVDLYIASLMRYEQGEVTLIDRDYIDRVVETMHMSATGITKYLRCKTAFYFENILRIPMARTANMGYGNAIHYALEKYIEAIQRDPNHTLPPAEELVNFFKKGMDKFKSHFTPEEFKKSIFNGEKTLPAYYEEKSRSWQLPRAMKTEYSVKTEYESIPISGIIDRVDIYDQHIDITDYKTGSFKYEKLGKADPNKAKLPEGGDYWRQVIFYKMLLQKDTNSDWRLQKAIMDFVQPEKEKFKVKVFEGEDFDIPTVFNQLKESYEGIKSYVFSPGCNEPDCKWCAFVRENMDLESPLAGDAQEEDFE